MDGNSCFCQACKRSEPGEAKSEQDIYVAPWEKIHLELEGTSKKSILFSVLTISLYCNFTLLNDCFSSSIFHANVYSSFPSFKAAPTCGGGASLLPSSGVGSSHKSNPKLLCINKELAVPSMKVTPRLSQDR